MKLSSNASKERSGTHEELRHRARRLDKAADKIVRLHQSRDVHTQETTAHHRQQERTEALRREAARTREFLARSAPRTNAEGQELNTKITELESAKMATSLYSQRIGTVEPVFANIRHNKRLDRLTLRGRGKVNAQWHLYGMVHNIEKLANSGWRGSGSVRAADALHIAGWGVPRT